MTENYVYYVTITKVSRLKFSHKTLYTVFKTKQNKKLTNKKHLIPFIYYTLCYCLQQLFCL